MDDFGTLIEKFSSLNLSVDFNEYHCQKISTIKKKPLDIEMPKFVNPTNKKRKLVMKRFPVSDSIPKYYSKTIDNENKAHSLQSIIPTHVENNLPETEDEKRKLKKRLSLLYIFMFITIILSIILFIVPKVYITFFSEMHTSIKNENLYRLNTLIKECKAKYIYNKEKNEIIIDQNYFKKCINQLDNEGNTPLHIAAMKGNLAIVKILCEEGAEVNVYNKNGKKAIDLTNSSEVYEYLESISSKHSIIHSDEYKDEN